jgi:hypothetical protein
MMRHPFNGPIIFLKSNVYEHPYERHPFRYLNSADIRDRIIDFAAQ